MQPTSREKRPIAVVILAAGQGTRMRSRRSKVLHEICGRSMLGWVLEAVAGLTAARTYVVVGRDADEVCRLHGDGAEFVLQAEQRGTGHAVLQVQSKLRDFEGDVLVLYADVPLLRPESLARMRDVRDETGAGLVMLTAPVELPGRVVRDAEGRVLRIVETPDATPEELRIREGNTGVYLVRSDLLWEALGRVGDDNEQGEIYLTDVVAHAVREERGVEAIVLDDPDESLGINTREELARAAAVARDRIARHWMEAGVTIVDPANTYIDAGVTLGPDTVIEPGCVIQGETRIGAGVHLKPGCHLESCIVDDDVAIGPYAHLRPGTHLMDGVRIGNFVEVKNSVLGAGVKADHLSYVGDADVGEGASFGCGAITVNYDWQQKSRTIVGPGTTVGCNANLIAPVAIGANSAVAAGSTVTHAVPDDSLAVARARQRNVEGWVARREGRSTASSGKAKKRAAKKPVAKKKPGAKKNAATKPAAKKKAARKKAAKKKATRKKVAAKTATKRTEKKTSGGRRAKTGAATARKKQGARKRGPRGTRRRG